MVRIRIPFVLCSENPISEGNKIIDPGINNGGLDIFNIGTIVNWLLGSCKELNPFPDSS